MDFHLYHRYFLEEDLLGECYLNLLLYHLKYLHLLLHLIHQLYLY
tara:strand:- start:163 stop:297 length:135 start_codon:yes stop_codon:yes gene_type:complete